MTIAFDNKIASVDPFSGGFGNSQTIAFTVGAYSGHAMLIVCVMVGSGNGTQAQSNVSSVTYNGVSMHFEGRNSQSQGEGIENVELWSLADPAAGTHNLVVTLNNAPSGPFAGWIAEATSYLGTGVLSVSGFANNTTNSSPFSATVSSATGSQVVGGAIIIEDHNATAPAHDAGQNTRIPYVGQAAVSGTSVGDIFGVMDDKAGAASTVLTWTPNNLHHANWVAISIDEAPVPSKQRRSSSRIGTRIGSRQAA